MLYFILFRGGAIFLATAIVISCWYTLFPVFAFFVCCQEWSGNFKMGCCRILKDCPWSQSITPGPGKSCILYHKSIRWDAAGWWITGDVLKFYQILVNHYRYHQKFRMIQKYHAITRIQLDPYWYWVTKILINHKRLHRILRYPFSSPVNHGKSQQNTTYYNLSQSTTTNNVWCGSTMQDGSEAHAIIIYHSGFPCDFGKPICPIKSA
jgi:hypothetical protein